MGKRVRERKSPANSKLESNGSQWCSVVDGLDEMYRRRIRCVAGLDDMVGELIAALENMGF
ncbi:arylsulfatase [Penicillium lagena]|uniref:arylsulfatase n=1 Tax=Penicillium lagena TaxID=94218 RepID=UPI0025406425|nr:arylsulfatase [Penicillium lagena]KAJ5606003.1 arylsulfatase [Penicillium lagena]